MATSKKNYDEWFKGTLDPVDSKRSGECQRSQYSGALTRTSLEFCSIESEAQVHLP
jgi:hypothetical protein